MKDALTYYNSVKLGLQVSLDDVPGYLVRIMTRIEHVVNEKVELDTQSKVASKAMAKRLG